MNAVSWIEQNLEPTICNSEAFFYDEAESQSDFCLPLIYQPFDPHTRWHWGDRGSLYDFLYATEGEGKTVLDFGPGDGWPSLIVAPFVKEVVGVDGSHKRVEVCTQNAARLGITNARFVYCAPGSRLPFPDESFDGAMAASSIEQTPDPKASLAEIYRVLRPGGRLRMDYEGLSCYLGGRENEADLGTAEDGSTWLTLYARNIRKEQARMANIRFCLPIQDVLRAFSATREEFNWNAVTIPALNKLREHMLYVRCCTLNHPSGKTYCRWLKEIGFREALPTHNGAWFARKLYDQIAEDQRPGDLAGVDALLRPSVKIVVQMPTPLEAGGQSLDPAITAIK